MERSPREKPYRPQPLGEYLTNLRLARKLTLREIEEATGRKVSNAYLSQLEHGRIKKPSPNILHELSCIYGVPYSNLMEKAGYITEKQDRAAGPDGKEGIFSGKKITSEEEEELLKYLAFIRSTKKKK